MCADVAGKALHARRDLCPVGPPAGQGLVNTCTNPCTSLLLPPGL